MPRKYIETQSDAPLKFRNDSLLLIFTRNPEPGKCKTRIADAIGDEKALEIYKTLLRHTERITRALPVHKRVYYSDNIWENDGWDPQVFEKMLQVGDDLGERMRNAFADGFSDGFTSVIVIGSDLYDITQQDLEEAFARLQNSDFVIGPAQDGGYYLLGMHSATPRIFGNKIWGSPSVLKDTLKDLEGETVSLLAVRNDIDTYEDLENVPEFKSFLK